VGLADYLLQFAMVEKLIIKQFLSKLKPLTIAATGKVKARDITDFFILDY